MRKTQTNWRRCWSRKWLRKFIAINLAVVTVSCGFTFTLTAGPGKKNAKPKPTEKVARKTDENPQTLAKELPKTIADNHPLKPVLKHADASLVALAAVKDYSTVLFKKELIQSKLVSQTLTTKIRHEPFSVYMKFEDPHAGREVIYVEGLNKGKLLAHDSGLRSLAGTLTFLPTSKEALAENRYPITQAGMAKMLEVAIALWKADTQYQEVVVKEYPGMKVGEQDCLMLETIHPQPRDHFKFHKTRLFIDNETKFPIRLEQYTWPEKEGGEAVLAEEYTYTLVKANVGLTDLDFDKSNPAYKY